MVTSYSWNVISQSITGRPAAGAAGVLGAPDIGLFWNDQAGAADVVIDANDLATDRGLNTAVLLSLFLDSRAEDSDTLPDGSTDRRGFWGDSFPIVEGDKTGSRLWLTARSKQTTEVLTLREQYAREALQWLLDDKVAASISAVAEWADPDVGVLTVTIQRPQGIGVTFRYNYTWQAQESL